MLRIRQYSKKGANQCYTLKSRTWPKYDFDADKPFTARYEGLTLTDLTYLVEQFGECAQVHYTESQCNGLLFKSEPTSTVNMVTKFVIRCEKCSFFYHMKSANSNVGDQVAWAIPSSGSTYAQVEKICSLVNVKLMDETTYITKKRHFDQFWNRELEKLLSQNAQIEKDLAIKRGSFFRGIPAICVVLDGGYGLKSLGRFNSGTCVVPVFGEVSGLLIDLIIRNLDCAVCDAQPAGAEPDTNHKCSRLNTKVVRNMEVDAIVEAFQRSEAKHGLCYTELVADGDTNIMKALSDVGIFVRRHQDVIHAMRKFRSAIKQAAHLSIKPRAGKIVYYCSRAIKLSATKIAAADSPAIQRPQIISDLIEKIMASPRHALGWHDRCSSELCKSVIPIDCRTESACLAAVDALFPMDQDFKAWKMQLKKALVQVQQQVCLTDKQLNRATHYTNRIIKAFQASETPERESILAVDLRNVVYHIFDHHENCKAAFCALYQMNLKPTFMLALEKQTLKLAKHAHELVENKNSNISESFVALYNTFLNGRRVNLSSREDAIRRAILAGLNQCSGFKWHAGLMKEAGLKTSSILEQFVDDDEKIKEQKRLRKRTARRNRCTRFDYKVEQEHDEDQVVALMNSKLAEFESDDPTLLEVATRDSQSAIFASAFKYRMTSHNALECVANHFNLKPKKIEQMAIKETKYPPWPTVQRNVHFIKAANEYGSIQNCGILIDPEYKALCCKPTGTIGEEGLFCLVPLLNQKCYDNLKPGTAKYKKLMLQAAIDLYISRKKYMYIWFTFKDSVKIDYVERDDEAFVSQIPTVIEFYKNNLLPIFANKMKL